MDARPACQSDALTSASDVVGDSSAGIAMCHTAPATQSPRMSAIDAVDDSSAGITLRNFAVDVAEKPMSGFGT